MGTPAYSPRTRRWWSPDTTYPAWATTAQRNITSSSGSAATLSRSTPAPNLVDDVVDLVEGQRFAFRRLLHDVGHRWRGDTLEVQRVALHPDNETIRGLEATGNIGRQFE